MYIQLLYEGKSIETGKRYIYMQLLYELSFCGLINSGQSLTNGPKGFMLRL